jgi:hypothetical protein
VCVCVCVHVCASRADQQYWERRFERAQRKRRVLEDKCKQLSQVTARQAEFSGPDFVEGPTSGESALVLKMVGVERGQAPQ